VGELDLRPAGEGPRVTPDTSLRDALALAVAEHADTLVVVGPDGEPTGSVTRDDLLQ
jgi:CBS domain-containing protein